MKYANKPKDMPNTFFSSIVNIIKSPQNEIMNKLFLHKGYRFHSTLDLPSILPRFTLDLPSLCPRSTLALPSVQPPLPSIYPRFTLDSPSLHPPLPSIYPQSTLFTLGLPCYPIYSVASIKVFSRNNCDWFI